jgi:uncharacterized membrane protein
MELGQLYQFVLMLFLVGFLSGIAVLATDKLGQSSGITTKAGVAINASRDAIADIPNTWMSLIVTIGVLAIIISLVLGAFVLQGRGGR